jgi:hypothetical protein
MARPTYRGAFPRRNLSQAELKARIETLGDIAITIAKKSATLAKFFL